MTPVTSLDQLDRFNPLGRTEFERNLPRDPLRNTAHVPASGVNEPVGKKKDPVTEYRLYDKQAQLHGPRTQPGTHIDHKA